MLDVGWSELLLIGVVALIVVGPKDLPHLFHSLGRFTAKARSMAREFTSAMEDAARDSGIDDATRTLRDVKSMTSRKSLGLDALDNVADRFEKWDPKLPKPQARVPSDPAMSAPTSAAAIPVSAIPAAMPAAAIPAAQAGPEAGADPAPRARRLRAVRRGDLKDD